MCQGSQKISGSDMIRTNEPKVYKKRLGCADVTEEDLLALVKQAHFVERLC